MLENEIFLGTNTVACNSKWQGLTDFVFWLDLWYTSHQHTVGCDLAKVLDYNMVYSQGLPNDKKWDNHFPGENSHLKADKPPHSSKPLPNLCIHVF